jgi:hypothetical protein
MIQVFSKTYQNRFVNEVTYFFHLQNLGANPRFEVIYEDVSDYTHYLTKYTVFLSFYPKNRDKIEIEILKYAPNVLNKIKSKRKLAILTKFAFYVIIRNSDTSITKAINRVIYQNNGQDIMLSPNAFIKSYYRLVPVFDKITQH